MSIHRVMSENVGSMCMPCMVCMHRWNLFLSKYRFQTCKVHGTMAQSGAQNNPYSSLTNLYHFQLQKKWCMQQVSQNVKLHQHDKHVHPSYFVKQCFSLNKHPSHLKQKLFYFSKQHFLLKQNQLSKKIFIFLQKSFTIIIVFQKLIFFKCKIKLRF